jgi:hypothetical protein
MRNAAKLSGVKYAGDAGHDESKPGLLKAQLVQLQQLTVIFTSYYVTLFSWAKGNDSPSRQHHQHCCAGCKFRAAPAGFRHGQVLAHSMVAAAVSVPEGLSWRNIGDVRAL